MTAENVLIPVDGGPPMPGYLARPAGPDTAPAVIVAHELFGVTADIRGVVDELARRGHTAIAPAFYHRALPDAELSRDAAGRETGFALLRQLTREQAIADVAATMRFLGNRPIAMVGFSFGGHIAYLAATRLDLVATVVLYGGWLTGTEIPLSQPDPTVRATSHSTGRLLYLVGENDRLITAEQRAELHTALSAGGHEMVVYPGVEHAFFWPDTEAFDSAAREDAWKRIDQFINSA